MNYSNLTEWILPRRNQVKLVGFLFAIVVVLVVALHIKSMFVHIHAGEAGVLWMRFGGGTQTDRIYKEGLHIIKPFDHMIVYKIYEQQHDTEYSVLSKEGLAVEVEISIRFILLESRLPQLHKSIGPDYLERSILPEIGSFTRKILGDYEWNKIYRLQGSIIEEMQSEALGETLAQYLKLVDLVVLEVKVPEQVLKTTEDQIRKPPNW